MARRMTKRQALADFRENVLPSVQKSFEQNGKVDAVARAEAWGVYTDALCKGGSITLRQYETWSNPF